MKKVLYLSVAAAVLAIGAGKATAETAKAIGTAVATIVAPVAIESTGTGNGGSGDLDFGTIMQGTNTVTMSTTGTRTATNSSLLVSSDAGNQAVFKVTGPVGTAVAISAPSSATIKNDSATMTVNKFTIDSSSVTIADGGSSTVNIGANLTVANDQAEGDYTGTYTVTASY